MLCWGISKFRVSKFTQVAEVRKCKLLFAVWFSFELILEPVYVRVFLAVIIVWFRQLPFFSDARKFIGRP
jgi:hypothetical protein